MSANGSSQQQSPSLSHSPLPLPASVLPNEIVAETSKSEKTRLALPLRIQELKPSTRQPKHLSSRKHGVVKASQEKFREKPERDACLMREATIKTRHDKMTFKMDVAMCKYTQRIRHPRFCVSQFVSSDSTARTIVVREPAFSCIPSVRYGIADAQLMRKNLKSYIKLLYRLGVGYTVSSLCICVIGTIKSSHPGWVLHLRNVMYSDFCEESERNSSAWKAKEGRQYERIDSIFDFIESALAATDGADGIAQQQMNEGEPDVTMTETDSFATNASGTANEG